MLELILLILITFKTQLSATLLSCCSPISEGAAPDPKSSLRKTKGDQDSSALELPAQGPEACGDIFQITS